MRGVSVCCVCACVPACVRVCGYMCVWMCADVCASAYVHVLSSFFLILTHFLFFPFSPSHFLSPLCSLFDLPPFLSPFLSPFPPSLPLSLPLSPPFPSFPPSIPLSLPPSLQTDGGPCADTIRTHPTSATFEPFLLPSTHSYWLPSNPACCQDHGCFCTDQAAGTELHYLSQGWRGKDE